MINKVYQPIVIEETDYFIEGLVESGFFEDYDIKDLTFVRTHLLDIFTEKFINGLLNDDEMELFTEDEFDILLKELVAGSVLFELKEKGFVDSYEDDDTDEMFFLTDEGKKFVKETNVDENSSEDDKILRDLL
jgi:hypothetical protein